MDYLYEMIFKRKSFHIFRNVGNETISDDEINEIKKAYEEFNSLCPGIRTAIRSDSSTGSDTGSDSIFMKDRVFRR